MALKHSSITFSLIFASILFTSGCGSNGDATTASGIAVGPNSDGSITMQLMLGRHVAPDTLDNLENCTFTTYAESWNKVNGSPGSNGTWTGTFNTKPSLRDGFYYITIPSQYILTIKGYKNMVLITSVLPLCNGKAIVSGWNEIQTGPLYVFQV